MKVFPTEDKVCVLGLGTKTLKAEKYKEYDEKF